MYRKKPRFKSSISKKKRLVVNIHSASPKINQPGIPAGLIYLADCRTSPTSENHTAA